MKTEPKSSRKTAEKLDVSAAPNGSLPHIYNIRPCPQCSHTVFGMPGGRDAQCIHCGYKDPCCSD